MLRNMDGSVVLSSGIFGGLIGAALTQFVVWLREQRARAEARKTLSRDAVAEFIASTGRLLGSVSVLMSAIHDVDVDEMYKHIDAGTDALGDVNVACARAQLVLTDEEVACQLEAVYKIVGDTKSWLDSRESDLTNPPAALFAKLDAFSRAIDDELNLLMKVAIQRLRPS